MKTERAEKLRQIERNRQAKRAASGDAEEIIRIINGFEDNK